MLLDLIIGFFAVIVPRIVEQLQQLFNILPQVSVRLRAWFDWLQSLIPGPMLEQFRGVENLPQQLQTWVALLSSNFFVLLNNSLAIVLGLLLFLVLTIMLLANSSQYRRVFVLAFPAFYRRRVEEILSECENSLVGWIRGTLLAMTVIALSVLYWSVDFRGATTGGQRRFGRLIRIYPEYRTALECNPTDVTCLTGCALEGRCSGTSIYRNSAV